MAWTTRQKSLSITELKPHVPKSAGISGRAIANLALQFFPVELFGAAARCSHLHAVSPTATTPESFIIQALLEHHVDDTTADFAVLSSADRFKDFVKSYFVGTVATGLTYLAMINDGYRWSDHFENLGGGNSGSKKSPDFVFKGHMPGLALVESKGSRRATLSKFDRRVSDGYIDQVEPHLGYNVGGDVATHGYCFGAYLQSTSRAELRVHHTAVPPSTKPVQPATPANNVILHNYATVFRLAHSEDLATQFRIEGELPQEIPFIRFKWKNRSWLTWGTGSFKHSFLDGRWQPDFVFAIDQTIAENVQRTKWPLDEVRGREVELFSIPQRELAGIRDGSERPLGAVFPDGFAVILKGAQLTDREEFVLKRKR